MLPINLAKHNVERAKDRRDVREYVAAVYPVYRQFSLSPPHRHPEVRLLIGHCRAKANSIKETGNIRRFLDPQPRALI